MQTRYAVRTCVDSKPTTIKVVNSRKEAQLFADGLTEGWRLRKAPLAPTYWIEERLIPTLNEVA